MTLDWTIKSDIVAGIFSCQSVSIAYTVGCHYNVVQYNIILQTALKWLNQNIYISPVVCLNQNMYKECGVTESEQILEFSYDWIRAYIRAVIWLNQDIYIPCIPQHRYNNIYLSGRLIVPILNVCIQNMYVSYIYASSCRGLRVCGCSFIYIESITYTMVW